MIDKTPKILNKKLEAYHNQFFQFNNNKINDYINLKKTNSSSSNSEVEFLDRIIQTISKEKDLSPEYYEKYPHKLGQLISIVHFTIYIFFQNKNSPTYSETLNKIFSNLFISLMKKLTIVENVLSLKDSKEKARMKMRYVRQSISAALIPAIFTNNRNSDLKDNNNLSKQSSNLNITNKGDSTNNINLSNCNTSGSNHNNMSSKALIKRDSMNSINDLIELTKSKLLTKRNLNMKLDTPHKNYLMSLTNKTSANNLIKKTNFNLVSPMENFVNAVGSELKNLTKIAGRETSDKSYFSNNSDENTNNFTNKNININNLTKNFNNNQINPEFIKQNFFNCKINPNSNNKKIPTLNNINSPSPINFNQTNNISYQETINSNLITTPILGLNKNLMNFKRSLFDKTASPFVLNLNNKNSSTSNGKSETESECLTNEYINNLNEEVKVSRIDYTDEYGCSLPGEEDSYIESEISFNNETKKNNKVENSIDNDVDEVDSQFDEMIELMDDIQLSDPYREVETEHSPREKNIVNISDFKFVMEIASGGYGRVDLYKKISTGDSYAIKTVDINKMVRNFIF